MNIDAAKTELMELLAKTEKKSLLLKIKIFFEEELDGWYDEMSDEEREELKTGITQAENEELIDHAQVMKIFDKWHWTWFGRRKQKKALKELFDI